MIPQYMCMLFLWGKKYWLYFLVLSKVRLTFIISDDSHRRVGRSNSVEVVSNFVKLLQQQNKKNYELTFLAIDALDVASFIFLARAITPPLYVGRRFLRARSVSWPLSYCLSMTLQAWPDLDVPILVKVFYDCFQYWCAKIYTEWYYNICVCVLIMG